jgi:hypothetical protein
MNGENQAAAVCAKFSFLSSTSAADLKFLQWLPQARFRNFKSKAALER